MIEYIEATEHTECQCAHSSSTWEFFPATSVVKEPHICHSVNLVVLARIFRDICMITGHKSLHSRLYFIEVQIKFLSFFYVHFWR